MSHAVIICGSRDWPWTNAAPIEQRIGWLDAGTVVVTGGAAGADRIAERIVQQHDRLQSVVIHADWRTHGRAAGPIRNKAMLDYLLTFEHRHVYAFRSHPGSRGTNDMIAQARRAGVAVTVVDAS